MSAGENWYCRLGVVWGVDTSKKRMPLKHRTYHRVACGLVVDRDLNAALNLEWFASVQLRHLLA